jgi:hypothetical protein
MAARAAAESAALNRGERTDLSPEVKEYLKKRSDAEEAERNKSGAEARRQELLRAQQRSREQAGR